MKTIVISPWSRKLKNENPKNYPWWNEVIDGIRKKIDCHIVQIGTDGEKPLIVDEGRFDRSFKELKKIIAECDLWLSVDNFCNHFGAKLKKKGIVLWGVSDPLVFGYEQNINLLKDRKFLRKNQFDIWNNEPFKEEVFVGPEEVVSAVCEFFKVE